MSIQQQASLAEHHDSEDHSTDSAILTKWYSSFDPYWKNCFQESPQDILEENDKKLLAGIKKDLPLLSDTELMGEHLTLIVGHMNTKEGELALCRMVLDAHPDGKIAQRIAPITERRESERTMSKLSRSFNPRPQQQAEAQAKQQHNSDFDQSAPMLL